MMNIHKELPLSFPGLSTLPGPLTPFYTNIATLPTGSGKSLTYIGTIFNHLLANRGAKGVAAVIVYPMNALINSQTNEFNTYKDNYERNTGRDFPITFGQYTGQEKEERRQAMRQDPPQVLLTNYMMLELLLTRVQERSIRDAIFENLRHLVFDELHTYRGRQGADVSMLIRRIQSQCKQSVCCIGTSATMVSVGSAESQRSEVARVASTVFGRSFEPDQIVNETLAPSLDDAGTQPFKQELHAAITAGKGNPVFEPDIRRQMSVGSREEPSLGSVQFARFVAAAIAAALTAFAVDKIRLLRFQALLYHESGGHTDELTERLGAVVRRSHVLKKRLNLFAKSIARLYVLHDSVNSFLPRAGSKGFDRFLLEGTSRCFFLQKT